MDTSSARNFMLGFKKMSLSLELKNPKINYANNLKSWALLSLQIMQFICGFTETFIDTTLK